MKKDIIIKDNKEIEMIKEEIINTMIQEIDIEEIEIIIKKEKGVDHEALSIEKS
jgi:hypothetical protein